MHNHLFVEHDVTWVPRENIVKTVLSDSLPANAQCTSAYSIVIKDGNLLQTELKEGERPNRQLDIPGGHLDKGETPERAVVRETFEETGVRVKTIKLLGYKEVTVSSEKPKDYKYPYPTSYMAFYLCEVVEEIPFGENEDTHGRVWISLENLERSEWCRKNNVFIDAMLQTL